MRVVPRFYTYRLWSQQNRVNGMLVTGLESVGEQYRERSVRLEARVADLGRRAAGGLAYSRFSPSVPRTVSMRQPSGVFTQLRVNWRMTCSRSP